jgi:hypothetical protein
MEIKALQIKDITDDRDRDGEVFNPPEAANRLDALLADTCQD